MGVQKVALIGTNGLPAKYGGFETLTDYLSRYLSSEFDITVYCARTPRSERLKTYNHSKLVYIPFKANGWQSMIYDALSIMHALLYSDVLVILGFSGVFAFPFKVLTSKKVVFNIGGIEWQKVRGSKLFARLEIFTKKCFERICIKFSDVIIVDNSVLSDYVKEVYSIESVLAEYGGDHAVGEAITNDLVKKYPFLSLAYDFTVSRAQEDMNIHLIIASYKQVPERNLVIISNWVISDYGKKLLADNKNRYPNIFLENAVYDLRELNAIRNNCQLYIHSHSLCGTAPSLTEAMSLGLPVLCFDVATNRSSTEEKSEYFKDAESLIGIIKNLNDQKIELLASNMKEIAERRYYWKRIVEIYRNSIIQNKSK